MTVYAAMRGSELYKLFAREESAQRWVDDYNREFPRGKRATVVPLTVEE